MGLFSTQGREDVLRLTRMLADKLSLLGKQDFTDKLQMKESKVIDTR